jgi:riboflavin kinase/FMN adenylyltransferase
MVRRLVDLAHADGAPAVVLTFDPPPVAILNPDHAPPRLTTIEQKAELLGALGADCIIAYPTDRNLLQLSPEEFFRLIIRDEFEARGLVEGANFRFGNNRLGDVALLRSLCEASKIQIEVIPPVVDSEGRAISSTDVRRAISEGRVKEAAALLGRAYEIQGTVVAGAKRGRTIGFPTANLDNIRMMTPPEGVYAGTCLVEGVRHAAAVNIGPNPTFGEASRKVEVYLLAFTGDLYGREIAVQLHDRIRDVRKFDSIDALRAQLQEDIARVSLVLGRGSA